MNIRQAKIHGETIVAKPILIVAIIDGIEANVFNGIRVAD
jgi:putative restriction endonuclease